MADKRYRLDFTLSDSSIKSVEFTAPQGEKGDTGAAGKDYVLTSADKAEIAQQAAALVPSGGGGSGISVTAEVGQTIIVKAVDSNGKPTEWEAADYQPRTHWADSNDVVYFEGVKTQKNATSAYSLGEITLIVGQEYTVIVDGALYKCVAFINEHYERAWLGADYTEDEDEGYETTDYSKYPFYINQGGAKAYFRHSVLGEHTIWFGIKEETVHKIDSKYIPTLEEMRSEEVEILPETTAADVGGGQFFVAESAIPVVADEEYIVNFNGTEYTVKCVDVADMMGVAPARAFLLGGMEFPPPDGEPPFGIIVFENVPDMGTMTMVVTGSEYEGQSITIGVKQLVAHQIPRKYINKHLPLTIVVDYNADDASYSTTASVQTVQAAFAEGREIKGVLARSIDDIACPLSLVAYSQDGKEKEYGKQLVFRDLYIALGIILVLTPQENGTYSVTTLG